MRRQLRNFGVVKFTLRRTKVTRQRTRTTRYHSTLMSLPLNTTNRFQTNRRRVRRLTRRQLNFTTNLSLVRPQPCRIILRGLRRRHVLPRYFSSIISRHRRLIQRIFRLYLLFRHFTHITRRLMTRPTRRHLRRHALVLGVRVGNTLNRLNPTNSILCTNFYNASLRGRVVNYFRRHPTLLLLFTLRNARVP